jgi:hypothetical protein
MEIADDVAAWIAGWLTWLPDTAEALVRLPVLFLVTLLALIAGVRYVLPRLGVLVVGGLVPAVGFAVSIVLLSVEFAATQPFRWLDARPPALLYGYGNGAVGFGQTLQAFCRAVNRQIERLGRVWGVVLLAAAVYAVHRWDVGFCDRNPAAGCVAPFDGWLAAVRALDRQLRG